MQHSFVPLPEPQAAGPSLSEPAEGADPVLFKAGMRRLASGICVVTAQDSQGPTGLLSTSVSSVSVDPPLLLVCINRSASAHATVTSSDGFCINILADRDEELARRFGSSAARDARFRDRDWQTMRTGSPALVGCLASFDCRCIGRVDVASHTVFFGQVVETRLWTDHDDPLLYWQGQYRVGCA